MGTTANGLVYPELTDADNVPADMQALAVGVDANYGLTVATASDLAGIPSPFKGMRVWVDDVDRVATYNGIDWTGVKVPAFIVERAAAQNMTTNVEATISFDTEVLDTDGMFTATSTDITIQTSGLWLLTARFGYATSSTALRTGLIYVNGGSAVHREDRQAAPTSSQWAMTTSYEVPLSAGDVLTLNQYQNSGGTLGTGTAPSTTTRFSGVWQSV